MDLDCMPPEVKSCYIVVNIYSNGQSFASVHNAYMRLVAVKGRREMARFKLHSGIRDRGVVFAKLRRAPSSNGSNRAWHLETIGEGCKGRMADSQETLFACGCSGYLGGGKHSSAIAQIERTADARHQGHPTLGRGLSGRMGGGGSYQRTVTPNNDCCVLL